MDAMFLYLETPSQPLNICGLLLLDTSTMPGGYSFERFKAALAVQVEAVPQFRMKLRDSQLNLGHPVWAYDTDFHVERHLHRTALPSPGGDVELAEACGRIAAQPLNRDLPLWEMWVIESLAAEGAVAVMLKCHHSAADGIGAAGIIAQLCGTEPDSVVPQPIEVPAPPNRLQIAAGGALSIAERPRRFASALTGTLLTAMRTARRIPTGKTMAPPFAAPNTVFNAPFTTRRSVAFCDIALDEVKAIKNAYGLTVNDVITALCAEALRRYLLARSELPESSLIAAVPVAVHERSDRPGRNQASWLFYRLGTDIEDPVARLAFIADGSAKAKDHNAEMAPTLVQDWTASLNPTVIRSVLRVLPAVPKPPRPAFNLLLSNVPGPALQLYLLGSRITSLIPFGPILAGTALNITAMSLNGRVGIGFTSCPDAVPDISDIARHLEDGFADLRDAAAATSTK